VPTATDAKITQEPAPGLKDLRVYISNGTYGCKACSGTFSGVEAVNEHIKTVHGGVETTHSAPEEKKADARATKSAEKKAKAAEKKAAKEAKATERKAIREAKQAAKKAAKAAHKTASKEFSGVAENVRAAIEGLLKEKGSEQGIVRKAVTEAVVKAHPEYEPMKANLPISTTLEGLVRRGVLVSKASKESGHKVYLLASGAKAESFQQITGKWYSGVFGTKQLDGGPYSKASAGLLAVSGGRTENGSKAGEGCYKRTEGKGKDAVVYVVMSAAYAAANGYILPAKN
jgi:hypothetical protein